MANWRGCIIVSDHDRKLISVHGPMNDDTSINKQITDEQDKGRNINCCSGDEDPKKAKVEAAQMQPTYELVSSAI